MPARALALDLASVTLRIATYKGQSATMLPAAHQDSTPYRVVYSEFASGNLIVEAMNAGAVDIGSWSEIPTAFVAASGADISAPLPCCAVKHSFWHALRHTTLCKMKPHEATVYERFDDLKT